MAATNKANMDAMMERMHALVAAGGGRRTNDRDKENTPPPGLPTTGSGNITKKPKRKKALCPNCKSFVYHSPDKCFELEANKACYTGWKSIFTAD